MKAPLLVCEDVGYREGDDYLFHGVSFRLELGQRGVVLAQPPRGATVLLKICATLMQPTSGEVRWFGRRLSEMSAEEIYQTRQRIGLVHRETSLISNLTIQDNISLGLQYHEDLPQRQAYEKVTELMRRFDLYGERLLRPAEISFEKRRLAVYARELVKNPQLFLLEHPSLDLGDRIYRVLVDMFRSCSTDNGCGFLVACLEPEVVRRWGDWVLILYKDGCQLLEAAQFDPALYLKANRSLALQLFSERRQE